VFLAFNVSFDRFQRLGFILGVTLGVLGGYLLLVSPVEAQSSTHYIFLIDTSGSMVGLPSGSEHAVIFPKVKAELNRYLDSLRPGDFVEIRTFDRGLQSARMFRIESEDTKKAAISHVEALDAEGQVTWVYRSILETAQSRLEEVKRPGALEIPTIFYVFTDGLDNDPQGLSMREMLSRYARLRREKDFLIYVTLGVELPPDDIEALRGFPHAAHQGEAKDVVRIGTIQVRARRLDFGFVEGDLSAPRSLALQLDNVEPSELRLRLEPRFPEIEATGGVVEVQPSPVDLEGSQQIRLKIINRDSLPPERFAGEIHLSTDQQHIQVVPDRIEVALSTVPGPTATVTLERQTAGERQTTGERQTAELGFGRAVLGEGAPPKLPARVELNASALSEQAGFYLTVQPSRQGSPAPVATWNGEPVTDRLLTSPERVNDLVLFWQQVPPEPGVYTGEIQLVAERLALQGEALVAGGEEGVFTLPYRLEVLPPPPPPWMSCLWIAAIVLAVLLLLSLVLWVFSRKPPLEALRLWMLRMGLAKPRLYGKLVHDSPSGERMALTLSGSDPIRFGTGTELWNTLPDQVEVSPRLRKGAEVVIASPRQGAVNYQSKDALHSEPLSGQALSHNDTLILSDEREIVFLAFRR